MAATIRGLRSALYLGTLILGSSMMAGCLGGGGGGGSGSTAGVSDPAVVPPVSQPSTGAPGGSGGTGGGATLAWTAPTENTDGSPLTDLSGYVISYGKSSDALTESVTVDNPSIDRYVFDSLPAGTYYFTVRAVSQSGAESDPSTTVSKAIG